MSIRTMGVGLLDRAGNANLESEGGGGEGAYSGPGQGLIRAINGAMERAPRRRIVTERTKGNEP